MAQYILSRNRAENRKGRKRMSDREKLDNLKLGKVDAEDSDGNKIVVCNLDVAADYLEKPPSQLEGWLYGLDVFDKKLKKRVHHKGLFDTYGEAKVLAYIGAKHFTRNEETKRGRKPKKTDLDLLAEMADLEASAEIDGADNTADIGEDAEYEMAGAE